MGGSLACVPVRAEPDWIVGGGWDRPWQEARLARARYKDEDVTVAEIAKTLGSAAAPSTGRSSRRPDPGCGSPGVVLVEVLLVFVADVGVAELPGSSGAFAGVCGFYSSEGVFPVDVDMVSHERAEACDVFVSHGVALGAQVV